MKNPSSNPEGLSIILKEFLIYPDSKRIGPELVSNTSEFANGPYIGFPSYAQPIIPETLL